MGILNGREGYDFPMMVSTLAIRLWMMVVTK